MPWTALPWKSSVSQELASVLEVHGIPTLVLLDPDGTVITGDARNEVKEDLDGEVRASNLTRFIDLRIL